MFKILMPALSPTMTHGNLVKWLKKEGDQINSGDILAEIETDKATMEVESVDEGILGKIYVEAGTDDVKVNTLIAVLLEEGEGPEVLNNVEAGPATTAPAAAPALSAPAPATHKPAPAVDGQDRLKASPLARRIAEHKGLDLSSVQGTGPRGRIIKRDVEGAASTSSIETGAAYRDMPLSSMRKVIASRLAQSKQTVPHFYLKHDFELDQLLEARAQINAGLTDHKITVNDFVIKACAMALRDVPDANASWLGDAVRYYSHADISVAVAIDDGLITPIVKRADTKSLLEISKDIKSLAERARGGKLKPDEFQGGSFSISNLGMHGIPDFAAIINPPQACILAVGAGTKRPVVQSDNSLGIATIMTCTLSVDHRVVDGKVGADFMVALKKYIENPLLMLV